MARHQAAFYQNANFGTLTPVNTVPDTQIFTAGTILRVPPELPFICMAAAEYAGTTIDQAQIETPTLRALANHDVSPLGIQPQTGGNKNYNDLYDNPLAVKGNESLTLSILGTGAGSHVATAIIELCDGAVKPTTGNFFTVRATGAAALSAGLYVNTAVTFDTVLPAGVYEVVGLRAEGANLLAARIAFVGQVARPGVLGSVADTSMEYDRFRAGRSGSFGMFDINQPPSVDCLGVTDTAQVFYFDLKKVK